MSNLSWQILDEFLVLLVAILVCEICTFVPLSCFFALVVFRYILSIQAVPPFSIVAIYFADRCRDPYSLLVTTMLLVFSRPRPVSLFSSCLFVSVPFGYGGWPSYLRQLVNTLFVACSSTVGWYVAGNAHYAPRTRPANPDAPRQPKVNHYEVFMVTTQGPGRYGSVLRKKTPTQSSTRTPRPRSMKSHSRRVADRTMGPSKPIRSLWHRGRIALLDQI